MDPNNKSAALDRLNWDKLQHTKIGIPNKNYISYKLIKDKLKSNSIEEKCNIYSYSTPELLTSSVIKTDYIAIIPKPLVPNEYLNNIVCKEFTDPLIWDLLIVRRNNINNKKTLTMFTDYIKNKLKSLSR